MPVVAAGESWRCVESDAIGFLRSLPNDFVDLLFTSPPYELARTYGMGERMVGGQQWVDWIAEVVRAAEFKVRGLIAINCEGQTRGYRYSCVPFLLIADLHREGFNLRKPPVFHRVGIPGSGGPDWLRNDYEPIVCVTRPGRLPWADNTACGHDPIYPPGGAPSHRTKATRGSAGGDVRTVGEYRPPTKANPGNVVRCVVGGGRLGHKLAHENEAPFPLSLAEFFVKSFCPPGGVVCDPFSGSGTTAHAATLHGRRFIGCDLRASQVELTGRRLADVEQSLAAGKA